MSADRNMCTRVNMCLRYCMQPEGCVNEYNLDELYVSTLIVQRILGSRSILLSSAYLPQFTSFFDFPN